VATETKKSSHDMQMSTSRALPSIMKVMAIISLERYGVLMCISSTVVTL
jgi:3D (Asp-Asp-Asp) domain-containing protein